MENQQKRQMALKMLEDSIEIVSSDIVMQSVNRMAKEINETLSESLPLVLAVMGGATVFTGMLLPLLKFPLDFDYIHLTRYKKSMTGKDVEWCILPSESIKQRIVLVLDDILDEGKTMKAVHDRLYELEAKQVFSAVLCNKIINKKATDSQKPIEADYLGFNVPNRYIFGCGMDIKGYWRNLPAIRAVK